jgi:alkanesulfonate monooxygenase SsuD/methylene tetrahydromethanopterin reductase-like flavin-dependent oxidoreductase (luciferase family)
MNIGIEQVMQSWGWDGVSDEQVYDEEIKIALMADELGYDDVWVVEHHFEDYSFCPDNFVYLAHLAALTKRIKLATGASILPWNTQPLRVAEKAAMLDLLSNGRFILGFGRGLSRREYDQFGIPMEESRGRFDEAADMILKALETGVMEEHHGQYFDQPRAVIRPKPKSSFKHRLKQVAMSEDSVEEAALLGAQMMQFTYGDWGILRRLQASPRHGCAGSDHDRHHGLRYQCRPRRREREQVRAELSSQRDASLRNDG